MSDACARWRQLASCRVDGELAETDAARLRRHLRECPACVSWLAEVDATTALLRSAGDTVPSRRLDLPVLRRRAARAASVAAAAATAAALAIVVLPQLQLTPGDFQAAPPTSLSSRTTWDRAHTVLMAALDPTPAPPLHHVATPMGPL